MKFIRKYKYDIVAGLLFLVFAGIFVSLRNELGILSDRDNFEVLVKSFGIWAPLVIIFSIMLEVIIAPLPGFIPAISAGFIFGAFYGSIYTYIGNILGSFLIFWISRRFGRMLLEKIIGKEELGKYERLISRRENFLLFLYVFPIFPIDIISGAFGLSDISFKKFSIAVSIGFIFHVLILNLFGDYLARLYFMI